MAPVKLKTNEGTLFKSPKALKLNAVCPQNISAAADVQPRGTTDARFGRHMQVQYSDMHEAE